MLYDEIKEIEQQLLDIATQALATKGNLKNLIKKFFDESDKVTFKVEDSNLIRTSIFEQRFNRNKLLYPEQPTAGSQTPCPSTDMIATNKQENEMSVMMKYGQGSVRKRTITNKKGTYIYYQGRYMQDGKQKTVTAKTQQQCLKRLKESQKGNSPQTTKVQTLATWLLKWFELYKLPFQQERTRRMTLDYINKKIIPAFKNVKLTDVTTDKMQKFINSLSDENCNTKRKVFLILKSAITKAYNTQLIKFNPANAIEVRFEKPKKKRAYEFIEQTKIIELLPVKYKAVFFFLCSTGLRVGEFLALTNDDIDVENEFIIVNKAMKDSKTVGTTKTISSNRKVAFCPLLLEKTYQLNESNNFFGTFTYDGIKQAIDRVLKQLKINGVSVIHSTRHTFASTCYFVGMQDLWTQIMLGHSSLKMTIDTYTNLMKKGDSPILEYVKALKLHLSLH